MRGWEAWRRERYNNQSANRVLAPEHADACAQFDELDRGLRLCAESAARFGLGLGLGLG